MRKSKSFGMPVVAAIVLAGLVVATPLSAQQRGRMQVHATVVDVSSSLDVVATLRQHAERTGAAAEATRASDAARRTRSWFVVPEKHVVSLPAAPREEALAAEHHGVTIFYY